jgi:hypothetical protein
MASARTLCRVSLGYPWSMRFRARTAMRLRLLLVLIYFFDFSLRGENIVNSFLQRLLGGVVVVVWLRR